MFWKKEKKEGKKFYIPEEKVEEFYGIYDQTLEGGRLDKYRLWVYIFNLFPEMDKEKTPYTIYTHNVFRPYIKEKL